MKRHSDSNIKSILETRSNRESDSDFWGTSQDARESLMIMEYFMYYGYDWEHDNRANGIETWNPDRIAKFFLDRFNWYKW